jgi:hypothetical protein
MKKPLRSFARGASFHTKHASNANVLRIVLLDANSFLAFWITCDTKTRIKQEILASSKENNCFVHKQLNIGKEYVIFIRNMDTII